ncbi:TPA: hypothetical protein DIC20_00495 [Candidatus Dependentiae bacterium]|nr:MAG: hypothetical protein US03_C0002G0051 [candidate division TM6 bacterium GW2011_GWF2_36_131]KKQ03485.1 MAG: hypothetical protein US13_C0002G0051 [candidate division TM6 bacterium GW2011_GWE2_36_25]KKQ20241.1 MAG: hypothetical protein US32_C0001G0138 [candidate division TM6 bacterium GW2011_GWA2_36_9]HBR70780.1 hypothetical protein [Candidatus Dependentiae bacterium]HCU00165.1 hypothetical protein [Candidatus Dependentiae bacterium]
MKKFFIVLLIIFANIPKTPFDDNEFIKLFHELSREGQKSIKTILFEACAFGKIKQDSKKSLAKEVIHTAFQLWQEVTTYTKIKIQYKEKQTSIEQLEKAKETYQRTFNELQKILVPQSRHFFESSNIIKTIKSIYYLHPNNNQIPKNNLAWLSKIKNLYNQILCKIKNFFRKPSEHEELKEQDEREQALELITHAIKTAQTWSEEEPRDSYKKSPFCILNDNLN